MYMEQKTVRMMGTIIEIQIQHESASQLVQEVIALLSMYERRFSANDANSELMKVNLNAGKQAVIVHPELYELIEIGKEHSCASDSLMNIAIGPLVQTWRIGFDDAKVPSDDDVQDLLRKTDPEKIRLNPENGSIFLEETGMLIDLGALAKGYIADRIVQYLKAQGVKTALINLGGNLVGIGPGDDDERTSFKIGIQDPNQSRQHYQAVLDVVDQSVVTSGIYIRKLENQQRTYHHILDPKTGYPVETDVASLTIRSTKSVDGEIWTTRLFGKCASDVIQTLNGVPGVEGLVITKSGDVLYAMNNVLNVSGKINKTASGEEENK
ncbi:FAD:protein FMN transferase [Marinilactibacillus kalidii]|uniref:FAD:protein FMN transferase n=1 Tax=Marinilactibacillus kalidii TaxID=2820274 RepID=UPI001FC9D51C|nr:FAD:protein FMN transferase [Marinilactibacillus kalidii]